MGATTEIAWTDATFNTHWGCQRVSPGCENCYAESFSKRVGLKVWGPTSDRRFFGDKHWAEPLKWNRAAERAGVRKRVFCASMADAFEARSELDEVRVRLGGLIRNTPWLDWQLLTKRPQNMVPMGAIMFPNGWPPNVWAGTTTEDQQRADERIPELMKVPAEVRFLSYEPALGAMDMSEWIEPASHCRACGEWHEGHKEQCPRCETDNLVTVWGAHQRAEEDDGTWTDRGPDIHWVIVGGESGHGARPFDMGWAWSAVRQCKEAGVACFVKQMGAKPIDGDRCEEVRFRDRAKGGDWAEWPADLRVREFPEVRP